MGLGDAEDLVETLAEVSLTDDEKQQLDKHADARCRIHPRLKTDSHFTIVGYPGISPPPPPPGTGSHTSRHREQYPMPPPGTSCVLAKAMRETQRGSAASGRTRGTRACAHVRRLSRVERALLRLHAAAHSRPEGTSAPRVADVDNWARSGARSGARKKVTVHAAARHRRARATPARAATAARTLTHAPPQIALLRAQLMLERELPVVRREVPLVARGAQLVEALLQPRGALMQWRVCLLRLANFLNHGARAAMLTATRGRRTQRAQPLCRYGWLSPWERRRSRMIR